MQRSRENRETKKQRKQEKQRNRGSKKLKNREAEKQETQRNNVSGEAEKQISRKAEKQKSREAKQKIRETGKHRTRNPPKNPKPAAKKTQINSPQSNKYQLKSHSYHRHSQEVTLPFWVAPSTHPVQNWNEIVGQIPGTQMLKWCRRNSQIATSRVEMRSNCAVLGLAACHTDWNQNGLQVCRVDQTPYHHELTVPLLGSVC